MYIYLLNVAIYIYVYILLIEAKFQVSFVNISQCMTNYQ